MVVFGILFILWDLAYTTNDISYWSMLPALSVDQQERERIGAFAKICANVGLFAVVVGLVPITTMLGERLGSMTQAYHVFTAALVVIMWVGQAITVFGVRENREIFKLEETTTLRGMVKAIAENDQLLWAAVSMGLFTIGYVTTTSFGLYFFKYAYGDEGMYAVFALILGLCQLGALSVFPLFSKRFSREALYSASTAMVVLGYLIFFFAPMNMLVIGPTGILIFLGEAFIQMLMLMFLTDTVEYGQWKLGKRNESVTFSLQPVIYKVAGAVASGIVGVTVILSGINDALTHGCHRRRAGAVEVCHANFAPPLHPGGLLGLPEEIHHRQRHVPAHLRRSPSPGTDQTGLGQNPLIYGRDSPLGAEVKR